VLRRAPQPGQHVLVVGSGIIGLLTLQAARAVCPDCRVTVMARYPHQAEAARRLGAESILRRADYGEAAALTAAKAYAAPMNKGMLLGGFDVVYDCVGTATTLEDNLRWTRAGGAVVLVGVDLTRHKLDLNPVWYQEVDLFGSFVHGVEDWRGQRRHTYDWVFDLLRTGALCADGLCNAPAADEMGELLSVQMTGANVQPDALIVTKTGNGNVDSSDNLVSCGNKCAQPYDAGRVVSLTAKAASGPDATVSARLRPHSRPRMSGGLAPFSAPAAHAVATASAAR
jgi:hypothetical protein